MTETNKRGRPMFNLNDEQRSKLSEFAKFGITNAQMALWLGVSDSCFESLMRRDEELKKGISKGRIDALSQVAGNLFKKATVDDNISAMFFYLKTRGGWAEARESVMVATPSDAKGEFRLVYQSKKSRDEEES